MKKWLVVLAACLALGITTGCAEEMMYVDPPQAVATGPVEFCDDWGCRMVNAPYYYVDGEVVYWDAHFGVWMGPRGYWNGGWHAGLYPGYHNWYHAGHYRYFRSGTGGTKMGGGTWHGYYHGHGHR